MMNSEPFWAKRKLKNQPLRLPFFLTFFGGDPHMKQKKNVEGDEEEPKRLEETWGEREANVFSCVGTKKRKKRKFIFYPKRLFSFFLVLRPER
jgi:hypothetical protein